MSEIKRTTARDFTHDDITSVVNGTALAVHIPGFVNPEALASARAQLFDHPDRGGLSQADEFKRIGFAFSEISDDASRDRYYAEARGNIQRMRDLFAPYAAPSDVLRLLLEETWKPGASLLQLDGRKAFIGICRYQDKDVDLNPHTDALERNLPAESAHELKAQLSINIYMNIPDVGGELELWGTEPGEDAYKGLMGDRTWGIDRDKIGPPKVVFKPSPGDLLLLNPRQIHAVRPSGDQPRITLGHFLGYYGEDRPLALWS
ncbi:2OG-Fe(II) oxygenase [Streptomyces sp. UNOC14_S4]|uniref:2OG-Fe(II)-dependent halogenase WelO5 family protein n=1 Tax=Streptomyces sp. UNOC14_S4 TaxID=2872340 RepID=UPI001E2B1940|nr:2OG-Fe(II) oxygenase [Streptomyces sp. UNOC14_S4]MCC3769354.1 2OG-Fe(II) oxygenase [Streptomyces sp. UNOC14_S4]